MYILARVRSLVNPRNLVILAVVILGLAGTGYYFYNYQQTQNELNKIKNDPREALKEENRKLIETVSKLVELPSGETPTTATVTDVEKLKNQPFFKNAQNGDRVLIYTQAKKAFLYRPSTNKIIEIAPINIGQTEGTTTNTTPSTSTNNTTKSKN